LLSLISLSSSLAASLEEVVLSQVQLEEIKSLRFLATASFSLYDVAIVILSKIQLI
jgi:hypothetical protein